MSWWYLLVSSSPSSSVTSNSGLKLDECGLCPSPSLLSAVLSTPSELSIFNLRYLNNQHSSWTIRLVHPSTVPSQHLHVGIGQVVQSPPLTDRLYSTYPCLPLDWNIYEVSHQHNIAFTYITGFNLYWSPDSSIHQHLPLIICIQATSKFLLVLPSM